MAGNTGDLDMPSTSIRTALTTGTFAMAALILLATKMGTRYGPQRVFQIAVVIHAASVAAIAFSVSPVKLFVAQPASGAVIALIASALVVVISTKCFRDHHRERLDSDIADIADIAKLGGKYAGATTADFLTRYPKD